MLHNLQWLNNMNVSSSKIYFKVFTIFFVLFFCINDMLVTLEENDIETILESHCMVFGLKNVT